MTIKERFENKANHIIEIIKTGKIKHPAINEFLILLNEYLETIEKYLSDLEMDNFQLITEIKNIENEAMELTEILKILGYNQFMFKYNFELTKDATKLIKQSFIEL